MQPIIDFIWNNGAVVIAALLAISEVLSLIPSVKSNGLFQLIVNLLKKSKS